MSQSLCGTIRRRPLRRRCLRSLLRAGTIRLYLGSYEMFLDFVTQERVRAGIVPELDTDVAKNIPKHRKEIKELVKDRRPRKAAREVLKGVGGHRHAFDKQGCGGI